jgi:hypothetical protein
LDLVPADAAGFVHVRLADLWTSEAFADFRFDCVRVARPEALRRA